MSKDKVVQLGEQRASEKMCLQAIENAARSVRAGGVTTVFVVIEKEGHYETLFAGSESTSMQGLVGQLEISKMEIVMQAISEGEG